MVEIAPSFLEVKEGENIIKLIYDLETANIDYFHIDVVDGEFIPRNTVERMMNYSTTMKQISNIPLDVHLMVKDPRKYVDEYLALNPSIITFHIEVIENEKEVLDLIQYIKENGSRVGISMNPATKAETIFQYLDKIHVAHFMSVEPGYGGQGFIPEVMDKMKELKQYIDIHNLEVDIEVDGGINDKTIEIAKNAGANIMVCGSYLMNSEDYKETVKKLKNV